MIRLSNRESQGDTLQVAVLGRELVICPDSAFCSNPSEFLHEDPCTMIEANSAQWK